MRGLLSRGIRPSLNFTERISALPPLPKIAPPQKTSFNACDTFAILLAPVLTTAFWVDTVIKIRRSDEFDKQIATLRRDTEELRHQQLKRWVRLQDKSIRHGVAQQRRHLSTAVEFLRPDFEEMDAVIDNNSTDADDEGFERPALVDISEEHRSTAQKFDRLVATRLALQLMLQLKTARSSKHFGFVDLDEEPVVVDANVNTIINNLDVVIDQMRKLNLRDLPWDIPQSPETREKKDRASFEIDILTKSYRKNEIPMADYIMGYASIIAKYRVGPQNATYVRMMRAFHSQDKRVFTIAAENAIWDGKVSLSAYAISALLFRQAADMDALRFYHFKRRLVTESVWPRPQHPWIEARANDMQICIPESRNPFIISGLIRTALYCRQTLEAEAYAVPFIQSADHNEWREYPNLKYFVSSAFLQHYSVIGSWTRALPWMLRACRWIEQMLDGFPKLMGRLILRMLDLCVACERQEEYTFILDAAVECGLSPSELDLGRPINVTPRMAEIRLDWSERAKIRGNLSKDGYWKPFESPEGRRFVKMLISYFSEHASQPVESSHPAYTEYSRPRRVPTSEPFLPDSQERDGLSKREPTERQLLGNDAAWQRGILQIPRTRPSFPLSDSSASPKLSADLNEEIESTEHDHRATLYSSSPSTQDGEGYAEPERRRASG